MQPTQILSTAASVVTLPARLALRATGRLLGGDEQQQQQHQPPPRRTPGADRQHSTDPKPLDDVALARKVESVIFRGTRAQKGKIDVNAADGVVWLRGEAKTPDLINQLEAKAKAVPEVRQVENLLHLPKTAAPTRTDTPREQRKTRRTPRKQAQRKVTPSPVTAERPATGGEPKPADVARRGGGRPPAPLDGR